ncbi:MAG: hypothetical protein JXA78_17905 [Anaerolineales bacterium]|nr:hypothetical protein [Anaerolineales bacterium]
MFRKLFKKEARENKQPEEQRQVQAEAKARPEDREADRDKAQNGSQAARRFGEEKEIDKIKSRDERLARREHQAAESILENESLAADLDDETAKELIDWGLSGAKTVAQSTASLDDEQAEQVISERLRATRRLMRSVNKLVSKRAEMDAEESAQLLDQINEQAAAIYGQAPLPAQDERRQAILKRLAGSAQDPARMVADLRGLFEKPVEAPHDSPGEKHGYKIHPQHIDRE